MGSRQITRLPSASGTPQTSPDSYPPALTGWPGSGRSWPSQRHAWSSASSTWTGDVVATALAEPGRAEHCAGAVIPGYGHVSMVFVHPDMWGQGVGRQLLQGLHERASERGWSL